MEWDKACDSTKLWFPKRTVEIGSLDFHTPSPEDAGSLWKAIVSTPAMNKALDWDDIPQ